jgi:UDP-GlcNAc:undecaprenyl-phosphate/decaprenyl-phosphate GlcNAc-1-phosphate transferase
VDFLSAICYFIAGGAILSLLINSLLLRFSRTLGIRNKNDVTIRWSNESKPSLGGIAMFFIFIFSIIAYAILIEQEDVFDNKLIQGFLGAGGLAFLIGIADDAYNTRPFLKLLGQICCGILLVFTGSIIQFSQIAWVDALLTVFWVVAIMNSLNMLDNMDGITATVSFFILSACLVADILLSGPAITPIKIILVAQLGGLIGFLRYNLHPSKMFMGDTGSQFLSLVVSFYSIHYLWNSAAILDVPAWTGLLLALAAFSPAAVDTFTVVINRLKKGKSPMVGGKDHTTHHLVYKGLNDFQVWRIYLLMSVVAFILSAVIIFAMINYNYYISLLTIPIFLFFFIALYRVTLIYKAPEQDSE